MREAVDIKSIPPCEAIIISNEMPVSMLYAEIHTHQAILLLRLADYAFGQRKFGGNAQAITKQRWLHHTSLLWDYDPTNMQLLKFPSKVPQYRAVSLFTFTASWLSIPFMEFTQSLGSCSFVCIHGNARMSLVMKDLGKHQSSLFLPANASIAVAGSNVFGLIAACALHLIGEV